MNDVFGKVWDILISIILLFIFPLLYFGLRQDTITQSAVYGETSALVDTVKTKGYLTKEMYDTYLHNIEQTHIIGEIHLEHHKLVLEPEYRIKTAEEVVDEQNAAWTGSNIYTYVPVITQVPDVEDPVDNSGLSMNTETNESILAKAVNTPPSPTHIHDLSCYSGHRHERSGCIYYPGHSHSASCYHQHTSSCYSRCSGTVGLTYIMATSCLTCGKPATIFVYQCNVCGVNPYYIISGTQCRHGGQYGTGMGHVETLTCNLSTTDPICGLYSGQGAGYSCGLTQDSTYDCGSIINSISATNPNQIIYLNDRLITTAMVTYKNGSKKTVLCSADFTPNILVKNKTVTLSYSATVEGKLFGPFTTKITVTVIPKTKICVNGHVYNLNPDGSDPGCIYCNSWLSNLAVTAPASGRITIYKGSTLEANGVVLQATYMNGRTELLYSSYSHNLDVNYVGTQIVTLSYKGKYTSIEVTTKRSLVKCSICGRFYELYPDGSDPGCPYCTALIPVFTGNIMRYYTNLYSEDILTELYEGSGVYYFNAGDYFKIEIANKQKTLGTKLIGALLPNIPETSIQIDYGGIIRDEAISSE